MITLREFETICNGEGISCADFRALGSLITERDDEFQPFRLFYKGRKECISARNYVGSVGFSDGNTLEILPKIKTSEEDARRIFLDMLEVIWDLEPREYSMTKASLTDCSIFEFMISMFLREIERILAKGVRSDYSEIERNENFLKGKLMVGENVKYNLLHKERFYVKYEVFGINSPENRILKATMMKLKGVSHSPENRLKLNRFIELFDSVPPVMDIISEYRKCGLSRNSRHYGNALSWSRLFLLNKGLSTFSGTNLSYSFLFPMERVYELYVAKMIARSIPKGCKCREQVQSKRLFDNSKRFGLRPDLLLERKDGKRIVFDTKWKSIDSEDELSISDMTQMHSYITRYGTVGAVLIYPDCSIHNTYVNEIGPISIRRFDLSKTKESVMSLIDEFIGSPGTHSAGPD